jgi:hypothetical protein
MLETTSTSILKLEAEFSSETLVITCHKNGVLVHSEAAYVWWYSTARSLLGAHNAVWPAVMGGTYLQPVFREMNRTVMNKEWMEGEREE